ncbi:hypothetical protein ACHAXR_003958, partial [Thalassiosira sp. AJA248-18]
MVSIAHGNMDYMHNPQSQLSWSDFTELMKQTKDMQDRIETLEQQQPPLREPEEKIGLLGEHVNGESVDSSANRRLTESMIEEICDKKYEFPESAYTLLITENLTSIPFATGIIAALLSMMCLVLAFRNELDNATDGNPLGLPAGVVTEVRIAQYLGVIIGVLMEEEIPQGLELIGKGAEQQISGGTRYSMTRIALPSLLRMAIGYTFLSCLFLTVVQESTVLDIFFDVLALQFVENIDDVIFALSKRGFFGRTLRQATNNTYYIESSQEKHAFRRWTKRIIRFVYIFNICFGIGVLSYLTHRQEKGDFRCGSVYVAFGDALWEKAYVIGDPNPRLLIYSHFNGIYVENGIHHGRPKYTEQNKEDGDAFKKTIGAEIVYCEDIESWVFRHDNIRTAPASTEVALAENENECSWLLRSPGTDSYDIIELADENEWFVWKGLIEDDYKVSIECNECYADSDCNYNGKCDHKECICLEDHFGIHCQFELPCAVIRSEKDNTTMLTILQDKNDEEGVTFVEEYSRPMYVINNMTGKPFSLMRDGYPDDDDSLTDDDFFEVNNSTTEFQELMKNYTFVLRYTGRRWY